MNTQTFHTNGVGRFAIALAAVLLGSSALVHAGTKTSAPAPRPSAPARPAASAPRPGGGAGAAHPGTGGAAGASHGPSANGPSANGGASHGPTANGPSANGGAASHGPTANGGSSATHSPSANGGSEASHSPTANGGGASHSPSAAGGGKSGNTATGKTGEGGAGGGRGGNTASTRPGGSTGPKAEPKGVTHLKTANGSSMSKRADGKPRDVHDAKRGMDIHHGLDGSKHVEMKRADGSRLVSEHGRPGFVERGYHFHGHDFNHRSYYFHGRMYDRYYRGYTWGGVYVNVYAPAYYYNPYFYGWAYNPWAVPVVYPWGFAAMPWYGFYGGYFAPYPVYPTPALWLTDYMISADLAAAYTARQEAGLTVQGDPSAQGQPPALTPEVKQQIADEVRAQIALENSEAQQTAQQKDVDPASSGIGRVFSEVEKGSPHLFLVGGSMDVTTAEGQECSLSDGDALVMSTAPGPNDTNANVTVVATKGGKECPRASTVNVAVSDLQDMQNHLRENIDAGLKEMKDKQGQNGLPSAPASAQAAPVQADYAQIAPPPNPADKADLEKAGADADKSEAEVSAAAQNNAAELSPGPSKPGQPIPTVEIGETAEEVKSFLGAPIHIADNASKTIFYYTAAKVTFRNGRVSEVS